MDDLQGASADSAFAQTVRNRLDAIARMGGPAVQPAATALIGPQTDSSRVSALDELTRSRPPLGE